MARRPILWRLLVVLLIVALVYPLTPIPVIWMDNAGMLPKGPLRSTLRVVTSPLESYGQSALPGSDEYVCFVQWAVGN